MNEASLKIILHQFKNNNITEEEAIQLIGSIYNNYYKPNITPYWPQITYSNKDTLTPPFEVTCTYDFVRNG